MEVLKDLGYETSLSDLKYNTHLRPYMNNNIDFNIAHSGSIVMCCGTTKGKIGIDIEHIKVIDLSDYEDYFTINEWKKINSYADIFEGFYRFWTRKEAVLKAIGTGFHTPLSSVDVAEDIVVYDNIPYYLQPVNVVNGYQCHIASTVKPEIVKPICVTV
jgi:4'-phosphopantetheinyl transferase